MRKLAITLLSGAAFGLTVSGAAFAADLPAKAPIYKAPVVAAPFSWTGFYVGGHLGYGWSKKDWAFDGGTSTNHTADGFIGGGQLGYNWQFAPNWVLGIEGDIAWSDMKGSSACPNAAYTCRTDVNWLATLTGRLGYSFDRALVYVKGGGAWADDDYTADGVAPTYSASHTRSGWTVGVGLEYAFAPAWSAKVEYNYIDFGSKHVDLTAATGAVDSMSVDQTVNLFKVGVNYRFGAF